MTRILGSMVVFFVAGGFLFSADWPGWRGPDRTGISRETGLLKNWPAEGPKLLWKSDRAGLGYAGIAVVDGTVYTMGARGEDEFLLALDEKGGERWATKIGPVWDFKSNSWSRGPNSTPLVEGGRVFALSSKGMFLAADQKSGKEIWKIDVAKDLQGEVNPIGGGPEKIGWGYSWSPLVDGEYLILTPGGPKGLFAAVDKSTGKVAWRSTQVTDQATYSSPVAATIHGVRQYIAATQNAVVGVSAKDGALLWKHARENDCPDVVCPTPIVREDQVYMSVGYGVGSEMLKLSRSGEKFEVSSVWSEKTIGNKQGGVVMVGDYLYGFHENRVWVCQNMKTGKTAWPKSLSVRQKLKDGGFLAADGLLFILDEMGNVGLAEASPKSFQVLSQFKLPEETKNRKSGGKIWTHPALSEGRLYLRDQEWIFCYQVK